MSDPSREKTAHLKPQDAASLEHAVSGMGKQLRDALPPLAEPELRRDLWPEMLRRLEQSPVRVPWFDWALLGVAGAALFFFPALIPALLYHL